MNYSKTPIKTSKNPNPKYVPPATKKSTIVKIVHAKDYVYDVYVNNEWRISYRHPDNVFDYLNNNFNSFTLEFEDRSNL